MDFEDRLGRLRPGLEPAEIHALLLEQTVPGLDTGIVPAVPLPAHAAAQVVPGEPGLVVPSGVLAPAVRVMEHTRGRAVALHGLVERGEDEVLRHPRAGGPPHDLPRVEILETRHVEPPFRRGDIRDIGHPDLVRPRRHELRRQHVIGHREAGPGVGRRLIAPDHPGSHPVLLHQLGHRFGSHPVAVAPERRRDLGAAVAAPGLFPDRLNPTQALRPPLGRATRRAVDPRIEPAAGDLEPLAHLRDREVAAVVPHERVFYFRSLVTRRTAFVKIAFSSWRSRTWRRSSSRAWSSVRRRPLPTKGSPGCWRAASIHL